MKKISFAALLMAVVMMFTVLAGCAGSEGTVTEGVLTVGTNAEFPPFEYIGDDGEPDGFDMAMMALIAEELNLELKVENMEFKSLIAAIESNQIDCAAAGMTVDPDRAKAVSFSDTYFTATQKVIVKEGSDIATNEDLVGKKIGVQEGTTGDFCCDDIADCEVSRFKKGVDAVMDLKNGNVDAVIIDSNPANVFVAENEGLVIVEGCVFEPEYYAIAVDPDKQELLAQINAAIKTIKENGKYDELVETYINN